MADLASLALEVKSDSVKQANVELRAMGPAASAAERAAQRWGTATTAAGRSTEEFSKRVQGTIRNLEFERQQLGRSAAEKARYTALRRAGVTAASAEGQAIMANVAALQAEQAAMRRREAEIMRVQRAAATAGLAMVVFAGLMARQFVTNTIEAEKVQAQLASAIRSTGGVAGQTVQSLNEHAAALQKITTFGDETINTAQGLLLTFTNIRGDVFPKATEAVLNVATALNTDLKSAALQVGKALNDPVQGVTALARAGIQFSDAQKAQIKALVESGQLVAAQTIVLKELETQFGGSARAARDTLGGALQSLKNAWGDLFEIGGDASKMLRREIETLTAAISNPSFVEFVQLIGGALFYALKLVAAPFINLINTISWLMGIGKQAGNVLIGAFVGAYEAIKIVWSGFGDVMGAAFTGAVNLAIEAINTMVQRFATGIDKLIDIANKIPGVDIGKIGTVTTIDSMANPAADRLGGLLDEAGLAASRAMRRDWLGRDAGDPDNVGVVVGAAGSAAPFGPPGMSAEAQKAYDKIILAAQKFIAQKKLETETLGMNAEQAARLKNEQELLNRAAEAGLKLGPAQIAQLKGLAAAMAEAEAVFKNEKFMDDANRSSEQFIATQKIERDTLYMTTEAAMAYRLEQEAINRAKAEGIALTPQRIDQLRQLAAAQSAAAEETRKAKEWVDFEKEAWRGFFADLNKGLREGASAAEIFGNAMMNVLNKISDKLMQMAADQLFEAAFGGSKGGGGFLSGIFGSIFSGGGGSSVAVGAGSTVPDFIGAFGSAAAGFAKGAAFNRGNVVPFARGGIVDRPTIFPMARGAGLMGEAGPEGILPLRRGRNGRLGVEASGGGGDTVVVNIDQHVSVGEFVTSTEYRKGLRSIERASREGAVAAVAAERRKGGPMKSVFRGGR